MDTARGKRDLGAVYTPANIADFMASLAPPPPGSCWDVLEPACADAPFLQAFVRQAGKGHRLTGVEFDPDSLSIFQVPQSRHVHADYLLWEPGERYDLIIGNPPYGIIGAASHYPLHGLLDAKRDYQKRFQTWHGKYNVYGAFIEQSVNLLKEGGQLVFVVPSTWLLLDDFAPLRRFLAERGSLNIYYLGKAFAKIAVVAIVLHFTKGKNCGHLSLYDQTVPAAEATGCADKTPFGADDADLFPSPEGGSVRIDRPFRAGANYTENYRGDLICFHTPETREFETQSDVTLGEVFKVHFAARSPEYKKSAWVSETREPGTEAVLTGRNLKPGWIDYDRNYSGLWMKPEHAPKMRSFYGFPHIVVAHTKGAKVVAAYDTRCAAWREDFHLIPRSPVDEEAIVDYLNSLHMQEYVQTLYRDLTPHLTRTQLLRLPLPAKLAPHLVVKQPEQLAFVMDKARGHA